MNPKLTAERLERGATVYIRQSTPSQVLHHQESQRRQYALEQHARQLGFQRVAVIDEDLGRSGSGLVERSGFQQRVAAVCAGAVGAVFCIEASRLARNGREWHSLIEWCGLMGTLNEAVDPDQRLVAAELEARWNAALQKAQELEDRLRAFDDTGTLPAIPDKEILLSLAQDLPAVWNSPGIAASLKQRIVRILVEEVVVDVDEEKQEVVLLIHWAGGRHSELRVSKRGTGQQGQATEADAIAVIRQMSGRFGDGEIAATLNRLSLRTGAGNGWNAQRVYGLRRRHELPNVAGQADNRMVTLQQAAHRLGVSEWNVKRMIDRKVLPATQAVPCAFWEISLDALNSPAVQQMIDSTRNCKRPPKGQGERSDRLFSES